MFGVLALAADELARLAPLKTIPASIRVSRIRPLHQGKSRASAILQDAYWTYMPWPKPRTISRTRKGVEVEILGMTGGCVDHR